jgi:imidazolonepropionase-like amidohydrolase
MWKENMRVWMQFLSLYRARVGRVAVRTDDGFMYSVFGFGFIRHLELLSEAGFAPVEVIRAATLSGAEALGVADRLGSVEIGKSAGLVVVQGNPLDNFGILFGDGLRAVDSNGTPSVSKWIRYTLKDGIIYDAGRLLSDVRAMISSARGMSRP